MGSQVLKEVECPECGGAAQVKRQKSGLLYRWCMDCRAQYFAKSPEASDRLAARYGIGNADGMRPEPEPVKVENPNPEKAKAGRYGYSV
jgi:DNA-directed RNA polymerase subunit RPC12/RpoP